MKAHGLQAALAALLMLASCSRPAADAGAKDAAVTPVEVATAETKPIESTITAEAVLYPLRQSTIVPKINAPVERFLVNRGDHVRAGQIVALLEAKDLAAAVAENKQLYEQAQANYQNTSAATMPDDLIRAGSDVRSAQESVDAANKVYESRVKLYKEGALAQKLVEDAKVAQVAAQSALDTATQHLQSLKTVGQSSQLKAAKAQVSAAEAHTESVQAQLSYATIHSPINGVISDRPLNVGEMASSGSALLTVVDISRVVARANVPLQAAATMRVGQPATITDGGSVTLEAKVSVVSPAVDPNTTTVQVWAEAANPGEKLKLGSTAHISMVTAVIKDAVVVPAAAILTSDEGGEKVMLAGDDSAAHEQKVKVGVRTAEDAQILSGVKAGDKVIVSGALGLDDKAKIEIAKPDATGGGKDEK